MKQSVILIDVKRALKQNFIPAVCLQLAAICLGCSYYFLPGVRDALAQLVAFKNQVGIPYAIVSTAFFGGVLPFSVLLWTKQIKSKPMAQLGFYLIVWAAIGAVVDLFYRLQEIWFGSEATVSIVIKKMLVDQFVFSAFFTCPLLTIAYVWKDQHFDFAATKRHLNRGLFTRTIPTTVFTNWIVWIPAVCVIYAMPGPLQIPLFNLVLCFFVLLLSVLNRGSTTTPPLRPPLAKPPRLRDSA